MVTPSSLLSTPPSSSDYEKCREDRIRENMERMEKLGIINLSIQLQSSLAVNRTRKRTSASSSVIDRCNMPRRRSLRLESVSPVSYVEVDAKKGKGFGEKVSIEIVDGEREEIYGEEDEKLLGSCETDWTLFVDGYGKDGKRIYDQIKGKTCHQCRQKTLGHRTSCSKCKIVQGQFCGDCLFIRYGENVLEANKNPNWICPVCRGICNCSICRVKRGWAPTGTLYKKVASLGYKSVAHYLIQTRRSQASSEDCSATETVGAKKSLVFAGDENHTEQRGVKASSNVNSDDSLAEKSESESVKASSNVNSDDSLAEKSESETSAKKCVKNVVDTSSRITRRSTKVTEADATVAPSPDSQRNIYRSIGCNLNQTQRLQASSEDCSATETHTELRGLKASSNENSDDSLAEKSELETSDKKCVKNVVNTSSRITRSSAKAKEADATVAPCPDSIGSRLRKRRYI